MDIAITRISSKGQVVIPIEMRNGLNEGDKLIVFRNKDQIIMKQADKLDANFKDDLEFAKRTEEAFSRYEKGEFKSMELDDFLSDLKRW